MKLIALLFSLFLIGCVQSPKQKGEVVYVSIAPLEYVTRQIVGSSARIEVLVPETTSPESYEPTVQQIKSLTDAKVYISTGLIDFEKALEGRIEDIAPNTVILNLSTGVELLEGQCSHSHGDGGGHHHHGTDPHIWLSPKIVSDMGRQIAVVLGEIYPDSVDIYNERARRFTLQVDSLDRYIRCSVDGAKRNSFAIGHTSLTYFANDYGLEQIAIEADGKEPSIRMMKQLVDSLRMMEVKAIFYQRQTSDAAARTIAAELPSGRTIEFDPLATDWSRNMYRLADTLRVILND